MIADPPQIVVMPIEPIEWRYSAAWYTQIPEGLREYGMRVHQIDVTPPADYNMDRTEFLSPEDTALYKFAQAAEFMRAYQRGDIEREAIVLFTDAWNPAILQLHQWRSLNNLPITLAGMWHAGAWDPADRLAQSPAWAEFLRTEQAIVPALDMNLFSTGFSRSLCWDYLQHGGALMSAVTRFPLPTIPRKYLERRYDARDMVVCFPHRLAKEKRPELFDYIRRLYSEAYPADNDLIDWVRTQDICATKDDYYEWLLRSRVVVSCAMQETWGIAMQEGAMLGAYPVAPNALAYPQVFDLKHLYSPNRLKDAVALIHKRVHQPTPFDMPDLPDWQPDMIEALLSAHDKRKAMTRA